MLKGQSSDSPSYISVMNIIKILLFDFQTRHELWCDIDRTDREETWNRVEANQTETGAEDDSEEDQTHTSSAFVLSASFIESNH